MPNTIRVASLKCALFFLTQFVLYTLLNRHSFVNAADITPPITTVTQTPSSPDGRNGWYVSPVRFDFVATDLESGIREINYRLNNGVWVNTAFDNTLNLAQNPSFETSEANLTGISQWEATTIDGSASYIQDTLIFAPGYGTSSARITSTGSDWYGINNMNTFAVTTPFDNMSASVWVRATNVANEAYFKIYAITDSASAEPVYTYIGRSTGVTGTTGWTYLTYDFTVGISEVDGVYIDIGLDGPGTLWSDAVSINSSIKSTTLSVTVSNDREQHVLEYYSADNAGNIEAFNCATDTNCKTFKIDSTPPGNWRNSGAFRGFGGANHELYVHVQVDDTTSGLSTLTDKYQYKVDGQTTFGRYQNLLFCNTGWQSGQWVFLISPPFIPGVNTAYLLTPKTDFCNSNWRQCKTVRFYAEDLAGNSATKDLCINGPWIRFSGNAAIRSNGGFNMIAEPATDNTDGIIETANNTVNFFTTSRGWVAKNTSPPQSYEYDYWFNKAGNKTNLTGMNLVASNGLYVINGNYEITNQRVPNNYNSSTFNQIVFVNGNLRISRNIVVHNNSTALFVVKGNVEIAKNVSNVGIAIFADGYIDTAYDIQERESTNTLQLGGIYTADRFIFKRTLQGTNNENTPSDEFFYQPKYIVQLRQFFGNERVIWLNRN